MEEKSRIESLSIKEIESKGYIERVKQEIGSVEMTIIDVEELKIEA